MILAIALAAAFVMPGVTIETPAASPAFSAEAALDADTLATTTARENLSQLAIAEQTAQVANSSVNGNSVTGTVSIAGNAFQGSSGLTIVSANSGNNVAINSALNVNITLSPGP